MADNQISKFPLSELSLNSLFPIVENGITSQTYLGKMVQKLASLINTNDIYVTGGTYDNFNGIITLRNNTGGTFNITGYNTGYTYTPESSANKQNSLEFDGSGTLYPTVDAVNIQNNLIGQISINTGFISVSDTFIMSRPDNSTLRLNPSDKGVIFKSLIENESTIDESILQIPLTDIPLSGVGLTGDGVYIRFIGYTDSGNVVYSNATFEVADNVCQLGILLLKVTGGTTSFIDGTRGIINKPNISLYSNLEINLVTTQSDVVVAPNNDLTISNTAGNLKGMSVNWHGTNNDFRPLSSNTITSFTHLSEANALIPTPAPFGTAVTTNQYWSTSANTLVTLSTSGAASIQRWLVTINGTIALQYGEQEYTSLFEATNNVTIASFLDVLPVGTYAEIGRMVAIRDTTNLADNTQAIFYTNDGGVTSEINISTWSDITGVVNDQTDLKTILDTKASFVNRTFFNLGTGSNTTNIILSAGTNLITTLTDGTFLNFVPELSGSGKEYFLIIDGHFNNFFTGVTYSNNTIWTENRPLTINNSAYNIGIDFNSVNSNINTIVKQPDNKIIIGGQFTTYSGVTANKIIRLNADGSIDNTFNTGAGFNNNVNILLIQSGDSKILVGGDFTTFSGVSVNRMIRLNTDGTIDSTFIYDIGFNSSVNSLAIQSGDSKILVGGTFTTYSGLTANRMIRLNTDGTIDGTFNVNTGFNSTVKAIVMQPDNKILCCGFFNSFNGSYQGYLIRLNSDGTKDDTFPISSGFNNAVYTIKLLPNNQLLIGGDFTGYKSLTQQYISKIKSNGQLDANFNSGTVMNSSVNKLFLQPDNKILAGGQFTSYRSFSANYIVRFNIDGTIDNTFSTGGIGGFNSQVNSFAVQSGDSKILVGGTFTTYSGTSINKIARLNPDATLDTSFSNGGFNNQVNTIELLSGGTKILVGGAFTTFAPTLYSKIIKLTSNGTPDTSFTGGTGFNGTPNIFQAQLDGKILVGGFFTQYNGTSAKCIARLNQDGTIDNTFNTSNGFNSSVNAIAIQSGDSKIVCGGSFSSYSGITSQYLARLNPDGTLDTSFTIGTFNSSINAVAIQPDGKILVGGYFTTYSGQSNNYIVRLNPDGTKDNTFIIGSGLSYQPTSIVIDSNNKIVLGGGFQTYQGISANYIIRLNLDGSRDNTFNIGAGFNSNVNQLVIQPDGKIVCGGYFSQFTGTTVNYMTRLNSDGSRDTTFNVGTGFDTYVFSLSLDNNNKIIVGGNFSNYQGVSSNRVVRVNTDGSRDATFSAGTGFDNNTATSIFLNGSYFIGGQFLNYNPSTQNYLIRLNSDGTKDNTFNIGVGFNASVNTSYIQADGKILIGGNFTQYTGQTNNYIIRLNPDGTKDVTFSGGGTSFNNLVSGFYIQPDNKIVVGGTFTTYNGSVAGGIVRLNPNGSRDFTFSASTGFTGGNTQASVILQQTGSTSLLVGGWFTAYSGVNAGDLIRLNSDGSRDTTFNNDNGYYPNYMSTMLLLPNNDVIVGGGFSSFSGYSSGKFIRLNPDGTIDPTLNIGTGFGSTVQTIEVLPNNKLLIGGNFITYKTIFPNRLTLIDYSGTPDASFVIGSGFNNSINATLNNTTSTATTSYLIGGNFTVYNGNTSNYFMNLTTRLDKKYYIKIIQDDNIILKYL